MHKINSERSLMEAIIELENKRAYEGYLVKEHLLFTYESFKPINLIKHAIKDVASSGELKDNLLNATVGLVTGYISKKLFVGTSDSPFKKLLGNALMFGITNFISKNPETIKSLGSQFFNMLKTKLGDRFNKAAGDENN
jgi:hypothetical protein